jgi:hypothetical protein
MFKLFFHDTAFSKSTCHWKKALITIYFFYNGYFFLMFYTNSMISLYSNFSETDSLEFSRRRCHPLRYDNLDTLLAVSGLLTHYHIKSLLGIILWIVGGFWFPCLDRAVCSRSWWPSSSKRECCCNCCICPAVYAPTIATFIVFFLFDQERRGRERERERQMSCIF